MPMNNELLDYALSRRYSVEPQTCKICGESSSIFDVLDFNRTCNFTPYPGGLTGIPVYYDRCTSCGFIFTRFFDDFDDRLWKNHIYNDEYSYIDPEFDGTRAIRDALLVRAVTRSWWNGEKIGCDYGGGKGHLAEKLRSQGFRFDSIDPFGLNYITIDDGGYDLVSAFEVMEHFPHPRESFAKLAGLANAERSVIIVSTTTVPKRLLSGGLAQWWYAAPRNGHISLFAPKTFLWLARENGLQYRQVTKSLHVFARDMDLGSLSWSALFGKASQRLRRFAGQASSWARNTL